MPYAKGDGPSVVIALGGNALGNSPQEQLELVKNTAKHIVDMIADGVNVVVSHGNGPQVGMINNAFAYAAANDGKTPEMPFPEAGAMSQGYIGYQLSQAILNDLKARGIDRSVANVITQTVVNPEDPAFQNPTKPVGAFMTEEEAKAKAAETGWTFKEDAGRGWRQVVASPKPERIVEFDAVKDLVDNGYIVVSTGGGGVPVFETDKGYEGVPAVIDKDRSSAKLAADFGADMLVILTAVEKVCINFNKPDQEELSTMTVAEAREYIAQGQFAPGSMLPKVEACIEYVEAFPKGKALITSLECAAAGLEGVPAVIDKDRSSAKLAADFGADMLVILTAVEKVCINFNKPDQEELSTMTVAEAREYIAQGQFAPGSMLPKVEACIEYVEAFPKGKALITSLECAAAGLEGKTGTVIVA